MRLDYCLWDRLLFKSAKMTTKDYFKTTVEDYLHQNGWKARNNSNSNYSFSGLVLHSAGSVIANYVLNQVYPEEIAEAHQSGHLHLHNLTFGLIGYCAGWSLKNLLMMGFGNVSGQMDSGPAFHLDAAILHMINFLRSTYNEFAGAQAFSSVDTYLAPFVAEDKLSFAEVKQNMQRLVFSLNVPSRWGFEMPFTNLTFDWVVPDDLKNEPVIIGGKTQGKTYGEFQKEMDMINKAFLETMLEGDARGRIFTFPIPTYNLTKDFDWESANAQMLFKVTAKYGIPYFQNYIGSDLDPNSIRAMCCRLNLNLNELMRQPGNLWGKGDSTGSIGVVTINLNRLAYEAKRQNKLKTKNEKRKTTTKNEKLKKKIFFNLLGKYLELAKESLEIKRKIIAKNMEDGLMPYAKAYLGSFRNYFSTIGICGANEACLNLLGVSLSDKKGVELIKETLEFIKNKLVAFQKETGHLYNLEATPAESTAYRLALLDQKLCPGIVTAGTKETPYLTNSSQLPVDYTEDVWEALQIQDQIQPLYTGGTVFHTFLGEEMDDWQTTKALVKKIAEKTRLPYFTVTPTFSICPQHGRLKGEQWKCQQCGAETEVYSRIVGYFRPVSLWNKGKRQEFRERKEYKI